MTPNPTILYVDDEPINLTLFRHRMKKEYDVLTAQSGPEGLDVLSNHPEVRLLASDMKMPKMDGLTFIREVRSRWPQLPCIMITGFEITPEIESALQQELIQGCFGKPFEIDRIKERIQSLVTAG